MTIDEEALHISQSTEDPPPGQQQGGRRSIAIGAATTNSVADIPENDVVNGSNNNNNNNRRQSTTTTTTTTTTKTTDPPPMSGNFRLPLKADSIIPTTTQKQQVQPPKLLHPLLHEVPMHVRFGISGFLSNVLFMIAYNSAVVQFDGIATSSTIYSIVYLIFIPVTHGCISLLVFGWPERYLPSLMSNAPVGITAIMIGAALTSYLDQTEFNKYVVDMMAQNWRYLGYHVEPSSEEEKGEFYSSLLVLIITGVWTFILSVFVNSPSEQSAKKEQ